MEKHGWRWERIDRVLRDGKKSILIRREAERWRETGEIWRMGEGSGEGMRGEQKEVDGDEEEGERKWRMWENVKEINERKREG